MLVEREKEKESDLIEKACWASESENERENDGPKDCVLCVLSGDVKTRHMNACICSKPHQ